MIKFDNTIKRDECGRVMMPIVESFVSLNGEGLDAGKPSMFIRLQGCNLRCKFDDKTGLCDTPEGLAFPKDCSFDSSKYKTAKELAQEVIASGVQRICLTGGEPLAREGIAEFIQDLSEFLPNKIIEIETNGSIDFYTVFKYIEPAANVRFTVDYKCESSGEMQKMLIRNWNLLDENDCIKFVVSNKKEMEHAVSLIKRYNPVAQIIFSPMFGKMNLQEMWEYIYSQRVVDLDIKAQVQLHKIVYNPNQRGV